MFSKSFQFLLFSSLLSSFIFHNPSSAQTLVDNSCSGSSNYTSNSTFETNLNSLLSSLSNVAAFGFYNGTAGEDPNSVYGLFLCRGDVTPDTCRNCIAVAAQGIKQKCPNKKNATIWYTNCLLRYSDQRFFSVFDNSTKVRNLNAENVSDPARFNGVLQAMLTNLSSVAANSSASRLFATGAANYTSTQMIYGLVQCTRDLSESDCNRCLRSGIADLPVCCSGKQGGWVLMNSCIFRYEIYPFVEDNSVVAGLAPPLPSPDSTSNSTNSSSASATNEGSKQTSSRIIVAVVVPVVVAVVLSVFIMYAWLMRKKNKKKSRVKSESRHQMGDIESLQYDLGTIKAATNNFSDANKLGQGGYGAVYKGKLSDGQDIAVKRLFRSSRQGLEEFKNEVVLVAKLQHRNLVRLLGCCLEEEEQILVFEYVQNQSLEKFLFNPTKRACLGWERRYKIIEGVARGLLYLHEDSRLKIIHRDLKASNILLDGEMNPKISDFGTARLFELGQTQGNTSRIAGTYGYMSPEYAMHGKFSIKSDVFSFGVLVLEIVSGLKNSGFYQSDLAEDLPSYAWTHWNERTITQFIDATLSERCCMEEVIRCIHIGLLCVQEKCTHRPTMSSVVLMLNKDSITLPSPSPPVFSDSNKGESGHLTSEYDSTTDESDISARKLLSLTVHEESVIDLDSL